MTEIKTRATIDSNDYRAAFYGVLNVDGGFWTPIAFDSEAAARKHASDFARWMSPEKRDQFLGSISIVPVRIQLTELEAEADD